MAGAATPETERDLALLEDAARKAGAIALRYWRQNPEAWEKDNAEGPVSVADLAVNAALKEMLCAARPEYGWLSEESPNDPARLGCKRVFIVDPIDGTRAFLAGEEGFAVSLAVVTEGEVTASVVYLPARRQLYSARLGAPARRDGVPLHVSDRQEMSGARVLLNRASLAAENWRDGPPDLQRSYRPSLSWRFCLVAEGRHDALLTLRPTWEWDSAPGSLIARQAGALTTDRQARALHFNKPLPQDTGLIAAGKPLHHRIVSALR